MFLVMASSKALSKNIFRNPHRHTLLQNMFYIMAFTANDIRQLCSLVLVKRRLMSHDNTIL